MRHVLTGLALGLALTASACGGSEDAASTTVPDTTTPAATTPSSTDPVDTTVPDTTTPTDTTTPGTDPTTTPPPTTAPPTTAPPTTDPDAVDVKVYFVLDERLAITRADVSGPALLRGALTALLEGPTDDDLADGLLTTIPDGTRLLDLNLADGTATVDLSREFETGGGSLMMQARVAQVVFTATQFDNVDEVVFWLEGEPVEFLGGEGLVLDEPQTRSTTDRSLTNGIVFESPRPGDVVSSPVLVTGDGDVFEGDFPIVFRRDGVDVAGPFIVFAGAWGDWREFDDRLELDLPSGPIDLVAQTGMGCSPPECDPAPEIVMPLVLE